MSNVISLWLENIKQSFKTELLESLFVTALAGVVFFLPLKINISNICIGLASFFWLLNIKKNNRSFNKSLVIPILIFSSLYLMIVFGMIHTDNVKVGLSLMEKKLSLLIFPIILLISNIRRNQIVIIEWAFVIASAIASVICYYAAFKVIISSDLPINSIFLNDSFHNNFFTETIKIHPAYLSLFICLSIIILAVNFKYSSIRLKIFKILLFIFFLLTELQLMARAGLFALLVIIVILIIYQTIVSKNLVVLITAGISVVVIVFITLKFVPEVKLRMVDSLANLNKGIYDMDQQSSPALHVKSWYCAVTSWYDGNIIFGNGTGDEKDILRNCYASKHWNDMVAVGYDSHNEYLSNLVRSGLIGLACWLVCLVYPIYLSLKRFDIIYFSFIILIVIAAFSESILRGQTALVFYAFFNALYFRKYYIETPSAA